MHDMKLRYLHVISLFSIKATVLLKGNSSYYQEQNP